MIQTIARLTVLLAMSTLTAPLSAQTALADRARSPVMLAGDWVPGDTHRIDFARLPRVAGQQAVISDVHAPGTTSSVINKTTGGVNQHNYLAYFDNKFWAIWSDGPGVEDRVGQRVKYATSGDGLQWSSPEFLTPEPPNSGPGSPYYGQRTDKGFRYIARGLWIRNNQLIALAALDEAAGFFGKSLELRAFLWNAESQLWDDKGVVFKNTINNFPPKQLRDGQWMMSRRTYDYRNVGVQFLIGGVRAMDSWEAIPVLQSSSTLKAEEPDWWRLADDTLVAIFRDNAGSHYLHRSVSTDDGRTWSPPVKTNFPDATSKFCGLRLSDGRYVFVSNSNPKKRDPLTLSLSDDGVVFNKMFYLVGGRHVDYPHVLQHNRELYIAFAGGKQSVEVMKINIDQL